jgi:branched-chain amino acid transport system ATP-binding protein
MPIPAMHDPILKADALFVRRGRLPVLRNLNLQLSGGTILGILGANGAGKTTLLDALSGFLHPESGSISLFGERIDALPPHSIVQRGLVQVSQQRDLFTNLSVLDNLRIGAFARGSDKIATDLARVFDYFPRLAERRGQVAGTMSGGEQQMLAIGRALMAEPRVLLLDEPSAGLSPMIVSEIERLLVQIKETGLAILLVEQNMPLASKVVDRFVILRDGQAVAEGNRAALAAKFEEFVASYYV